MAPDPRNIAIHANPTTVTSVHRLGKLFMNRGPQKLGKLGKNSPEDTRFRAFYGASANAVLDAWNKLTLHALVPKGGWFFHLLWALMFMKLYGTESDMCANASGTCGAVDPKTLRKWVWPFIKALAELQYKVVSDQFDKNVIAILL